MLVYRGELKGDIDNVDNVEPLGVLLPLTVTPLVASVLLNHYSYCMVQWSETQEDEPMVTWS